eukprot:TRINITY_DN24057_c0_g1_i1.p1 TRINITY_DN24057_c0_g1~~TRINITY_DN24057_c0_g1_i1.p1  ORF type:complete len:230 (-),score=36.68 TRINITY_DN24057_c0_g1_i1:45-704(-)
MATVSDRPTPSPLLTKPESRGGSRAGSACGVRSRSTPCLDSPAAASRSDGFQLRQKTIDRPVTIDATIKPSESWVAEFGGGRKIRAGLITQKGPRQDLRPIRFTSFSVAPPPGINAPASFHEAHYIACVSRLRNRSFGAIPFATDAPSWEAPRMSNRAHPKDVEAFASQLPLPPRGRPGHEPLPTQVLNAKDSYHFARAVQDHAKLLNAGCGNPIQQYF